MYSFDLLSLSLYVRCINMLPFNTFHALFKHPVGEEWRRLPFEIRGYRS
jgi:hypothetical protein